MRGVKEAKWKEDLFKTTYEGRGRVRATENPSQVAIAVGGVEKVRRNHKKEKGRNMCRYSEIGL